VSLTIADRIGGCAVGAAVGDSIALPYEGLSARRAAAFRKGIDLEHTLVLGRGMVSDDTDHLVFTMQSLITAQGNHQRFHSALAWRLRWWLACLPAGIGFATLRAIIKLWLGAKRGVYSAGNGPCMRAPIIGAALNGDAQQRESMVRIATELTHTDPQALAAANALANVAALIVSSSSGTKPSVESLIRLLRASSQDERWQSSVGLIEQCLQSDDAIKVAEQRFGTVAGISGYVLHSAPFAIIAWYTCFGDYRSTIEAVVGAGGDTDSVAAMAGALAGATVGVQGIPPTWRANVIDRPHSILLVEHLARGLEGETLLLSADLRFSPWLLPRGIAFTAIVLCHGLRRLLPPW
jgi:ADP-ribosyl-[dinitrogen reductase] hydrolase